MQKVVNVHFMVSTIVMTYTEFCTYLLSFVVFPSEAKQTMEFQITIY